MRTLPYLALFVSSAAHAEIPVNTPITDAIVADLTDEGLQAAADALPSVIPSEFAIPEVHLYDFDEQCIFGACWYWWEYQIDVTNGVAMLYPDSITLTPGVGAGGGAAIDVAATITVEVNSSANPLDLYARAEGLEFASITEECDVWVDPFVVTIKAPATLTIGGGALEADVPPPTISHGLTSNHIRVSGCSVDDFESVANFFGFSIYDMVIDQVEPQLLAAAETLAVEVETLLEDAFASAVIDQELDLLGVPLTIHAEPSDVQGSVDGLRLTMVGSVDAPKDDCIDPYGVTGSLATPSALPAIGEIPAGMPEHLAVYADDDFLNNALFAAWWGGLLCYEIDDDSELDLPIPVNTGLLGLLAPGVYDELLPEVAPMAIVTRPKQPPVVVADGTDDVNLQIDQLGVELYVELDGRQTRLVNLDLAADAGVDLSFDDATGVLAVDVLLDDRILADVTFNEYTPDADAVLEASFLNVFDQLVMPLLGDTLESLTFPLPAFEGIGLVDLDVAPAGTAADRLGVYAAIGSDVPYYDPNAPAGCGCAGEGSGEGCDSGCATGSLPSRALPLLFPLALVALRRQNHSQSKRSGRRAAGPPPRRMGSTESERRAAR